MPAKTVPDSEIIRQIIRLQSKGAKVTVRTLGALVGMSPAGISRRLKSLERRQCLRLDPVVLLPAAVDACADQTPRATVLYWSTSGGDLAATTALGSAQVQFGQIRSASRARQRIRDTAAHR